MQYTIHSRNNTEYDDTGAEKPVYFGIEVQPPLELEAIDDIIDVLTTTPASHARATGGQEVPPAASVRLSRQDQEGTAFWIRANTERLSTPAQLARHIGQLIDPCDIHNIVYEDGVQSEIGSLGASFEASNLPPR